MSVESLRARLNESEESKSDPLVVKRDRLFELTVQELRDTCELNPDHPLASVKKKSVAGMPYNAKVVVDRVDIEAILENKEVNVSRTTETDTDGVKVTVERKVLGGPVSKSVSPPKKPDPGPQKPSKD